LRAFTEAAARDDRAREASIAMAVRMGMGADKTQWPSYLKSLTT